MVISTTTNKNITRRNVIDEWAKNYAEVQRWLSKIQQKDAGAYSLYRFCQHVGRTPTELLQLKEKDGTANTVEKMLDDFCSEATEGFTNAERFNISIAVKSFFKWNYRDLAKASGIVSLEKIKPYNALTKEILRKLYDRARNPRDRALIPFVCSTAIAKETLSNLTWAHLEDNWQNQEIPCIQIPPELLKGHGRGKYKDVRQVTFLTGEAKRALISYKEWIEQRIGRKLTQTDHIWLSIYEPFEPLGYQVLGINILRMARDAGVKFSLHDGRRWVNTALEQIGISQNWARKIRGRKVKGEEAPYSQPAIEQLRAKFTEAVPLLQFTSADTITEDRLRKVEELAKTLTKEQKETMATLGIQLRSTVKKRKKPDECPEGSGHCPEFQEIPETELLEHLKGGWTVSQKLSNSFIIQRET